MPSKTIIFCADGTWNSAHDPADPLNENSNVFKLFDCLPGSVSGEKSDQEKNYANATTVQSAKYINGVGNGDTKIEEYLSGALGTGLVVRIVRGYTYVSRLYQPGDRIVLVGFSRGAYTVRALAGLIVAKGLLPNDPPLSKEEAHRQGTKVWYDHNEAQKGDILTRVASKLTNFGDLLAAARTKVGPLRPVDAIHAVAVWDTVGSLGIPAITKDGPGDAFRFASNDLHEKVTHGRHAISKHEQRATFQPCVWNVRNNIRQLLFPGAHADVGGGYVSTESGLSNVALSWMLAELTELGVVFDQAKVAGIKADAHAAIHTPWKNDPWNKDLLNGERKIPAHVIQHESLAIRLAAGLP